MPADVTDRIGNGYALDARKGPAEESALAKSRESIRHYASHIMAVAVHHAFPEAKFAIGPPPLTVGAVVFEMWLGSLSKHQGPANSVA